MWLIQERRAEEKSLEMFWVQTFRVETEGVFLNARVLSVQEQRGGASSHDYYSATDILISRFNVVVTLD